MSVLLVEDELLIRLMLAEVLAEGGFAVQEAASGDEAGALIRSSPATFSLLVTDIHMPGALDGLQVARLMRACRPRVPVIYMSGRPDVVIAGGPLGPDEAVVPKPFSPYALLALARRLAWKTGEGALSLPQR